MDDEERASFELSHTLRTSGARLFHAFIDPPTLEQIWGVSQISVDARPGGKARAELSYNDEDWNFTITYTDVSPPERLAWFVRFDRFPSKEPHATLTFSDTPDGTVVALRMENFENSGERDANRQAWEGALAKLETILST